MVRILIADDHPEMRRLLRVLLETHEGWSVCGEASDGYEALRRTIDLKPDLVILDLVMPFLNGAVAAREIFKSVPTVRMLLFTMHSSPELEAELKKIGVDKVVDKKDAARLLLRSVESLLASGPYRTSA
jgi:DNA-binding NarL/FixJ family response regulator